MLTTNKSPGEYLDFAVKKPGPRPRPVIQNPVPSAMDWIEPATFAEALRLHMVRFAESFLALRRSIIRPGEDFHPATIKAWAAGRRVPRNAGSMEMLARIETRYSLPTGYFKAKLPHPGRACAGHDLPGIARAEQRRLAWHLPDDFNKRPAAERAEILQWVRTVIINGSTEYRRFQAEAIKLRYGLRFPALTGRSAPRKSRAEIKTESRAETEDTDCLSAVIDAPPQLAMEMANLVRFKTATLTDIGFHRSGTWNEETVLQKAEHIGLMFGSMASAPGGAVAGLGVPLTNLTCGSACKKDPVSGVIGV